MSSDKTVPTARGSNATGRAFYLDRGPVVLKARVDAIGSAGLRFAGARRISSVRLGAYGCMTACVPDVPVARCSGKVTRMAPGCLESAGSLVEIR